MMKNVVVAGLAAAIGLGALPASASAVAIVPAVGVNAAAHVELAHDYRYDHPRYNRHYRPAPPPMHYHHRQVRPWSHWRPYVVQRHYYVVGQPVYYSSHPSYGPYYRVRARDNNDVLLWLGISAITGAILFSNY